MARTKKVILPISFTKEELKTMDLFPEQTYKKMCTILNKEFVDTHLEFLFNKNKIDKDGKLFITTFNKYLEMILEKNYPSLDYQVWYYIYKFYVYGDPVGYEVEKETEMYIVTTLYKKFFGRKITKDEKERELKERYNPELHTRIDYLLTEIDKPIFCKTLYMASYAHWLAMFETINVAYKKYRKSND